MESPDLDTSAKKRTISRLINGNTNYVRDLKSMSTIVKAKRISRNMLQHQQTTSDAYDNYVNSKSLIKDYEETKNVPSRKIKSKLKNNQKSIDFSNLKASKYSLVDSNTEEANNMNQTEIFGHTNLQEYGINLDQAETRAINQNANDSKKLRQVARTGGNNTGINFKLKRKLSRQNDRSAINNPIRKRRHDMLKQILRPRVNQIGLRKHMKAFRRWLVQPRILDKRDYNNLKILIYPKGLSTRQSSNNMNIKAMIRRISQAIIQQKAKNEQIDNENQQLVIGSPYKEMLEDESFLNEDYDIQDKKLKQFYNHLDQINSQNYQATDYFPQWIVDEMQKIDQFTNFSNQNIFKLCTKLHKDRGINDRKAICSYLKMKVNFFKDIEKEKLEELTKKVATLEYEPKQMMIKQDDDGDFLLIIYEGKAEIQVDGKKVTEVGPHTLIGESALEYRSKRRASVIALQKCKCLALYKADYDSTVSLFKAQQKLQNQNLLRRLHVIGDWNIIKIKGFSRKLYETQFKKGQSTKQWQIKRTFQVVRRNILTLGPSSIFGMEEVILENPKRLIRARALEDTECLYANKTEFMEYFNTEDKDKFRQIIQEYTDFEKEGKQLLFEIQNKKNVSNMFLNAVNLNVGLMTRDSRSTSVNGYLTTANFNPKRNAMVKKFLQRIVGEKTDSPIEDLRLKNVKRQQYIEDYYKQNGDQLFPVVENNISIFNEENNTDQLSYSPNTKNQSVNNAYQDIQASKMRIERSINSPEKKLRDFKMEMLALQNQKKDTKTIKAWKVLLTLLFNQILQEFNAVNSNSILENIKGSALNSRNKSQKLGGTSTNSQNVSFVENGVKIRLLTELPLQITSEQPKNNIEPMR
ncbi:c-gmp dependent protein kinase [Stylonychia lemnae]|uniref:C-gmp dependent protein kinase n=1 Tax=Stylonychia lemnae TaxID=5949 RepID=A0A078AET5_STYLE|nr:c-gmp dependent protein kinase [Stylonychia lemnae]|eukprot:CDW80017.1 c-gmp dependent protein kinase [Stylonychia lemnae]